MGMEAANGDCDAPEFSVNNGVVGVSPSGGDDSCNIQGALDAAKTMGYPTVRLANGDYNLSSIRVEKFSGSLEGTTRVGTVVNVMDESIDCTSMNLAGQAAAAIKFVEGRTAHPPDDADGRKSLRPAVPRVVFTRSTLPDSPTPKAAKTTSSSAWLTVWICCRRGRPTVP